MYVKYSGTSTNNVLCNNTTVSYFDLHRKNPRNYALYQGSRLSRVSRPG